MTVCLFLVFVDSVVSVSTVEPCRSVSVFCCIAERSKGDLRSVVVSRIDCST